ncbi:hypothetical protein HG531_013696 [Fusarium graminearum]|nr:hypothetical protein HG531_013696 [Fusarium graminearum]
MRAEQSFTGTYLSTIDSGLIHTLHDSRSGTKCAEEVQGKGLVPSRSLFLSEDSLFLLGDNVNLLKCSWGIVDLSNQSSLSEVLAMLLKTPGVDERVNVGKELCSGHARQRVAQQSSLGDAALAANVVVWVVVDKGTIAARVAMAVIDVILRVGSFVVHSGQRHDAG